MRAGTSATKIQAACPAVITLSTHGESQLIRIRHFISGSLALASLDLIPIPDDSFGGPPVEKGVGPDDGGLVGEGQAASFEGFAEFFEAL